MARKPEDRRVTATLTQEEYDKLAYYARNKSISMSDALREAITLLIRYANEDYYPLAKLEAERINQLVDHIGVLSSNIKNLEDLTVQGFSSLINLTRGDNYLFDEDQDQ